MVENTPCRRNVTQVQSLFWGVAQYRMAVSTGSDAPAARANGVRERDQDWAQARWVLLF